MQMHVFQTRLCWWLPFSHYYPFWHPETGSICPGVGVIKKAKAQGPCAASSLFDPLSSSRTLTTWHPMHHHKWTLHSQHSRMCAHQPLPIKVSGIPPMITYVVTAQQTQGKLIGIPINFPCGAALSQCTCNIRMCTYIHTYRWLAVGHIKQHLLL